jgi:hypothetical protein
MSQGIIRRQDKVMSVLEVEEALTRALLAHFGTVGADGGPYVASNLFVYAGERSCSPRPQHPHFRRNIEANPRICVETADMGQVFPCGRFECDTTVSYVSVTGVGTIRIELTRPKRPVSSTAPCCRAANDRPPATTASRPAQSRRAGTDLPSRSLRSASDPNSRQSPLNGKVARTDIERQHRAWTLTIRSEKKRPLWSRSQQGQVAVDKVARVNDNAGPPG